MDQARALIVTGWATMGIGLLFVVYGGWPLGQALPILSGDADDPQGRMDAMMAELTERVWADIVGLVLLLAGAVFEAAGRGKRQAKDLDDRISAGIERDREQRAGGSPP